MLLLTASLQGANDSQFERFVTRTGDKLRQGDEEFRFISFNIPTLHYMEDNFPFEARHPWLLPNEYEIADALKSVKQMGGTAVRLYCLSVKKEGEDASIPRHVLGPGEFNEEAFRALDKTLQVANRVGVRVIIPFMDNWHWWGGRAQYAGFRGREPEEFWTDRQVIADFKKTIKYLLNRENHYTGVKYKNDKAILAWETGNELHCPPEWTAEIAAYVKKLDDNHLLVDGYHTNKLKPYMLEEPNTDIVVTHEYPKYPQAMFKRVRESSAMADGKKPYVIGEFGFMSTEAVEELMDIVIEEDLAGALIWGLRPHHRNGGFYWHSEPWGGDVFKAYHWPGFASGELYDETDLLNMVRQKAFEIRGLDVPNRHVPEAPRMLQIESQAAISWRGSAGAASYQVQRALSADGPWQVVGEGISDAAVQYRPLFNDDTAKIGETYYYRVKARNKAGLSPASNASNPVKVEELALVDPMRDFSKMYGFAGSVSCESSHARKFKEDTHRIKGEKDSFLVYRVDGAIKSFKVYCFYPDEIQDIQLAVSADGIDFNEVDPEKTNYSIGKNEYGYYTPILYSRQQIEDRQRYLRIEYTDTAQVSRVEIYYGD